MSACKFWENQLKTPKKEEESTVCSLQNPPQPSILEVSAQKCEEYLFGGQEKIQSVDESIEGVEQQVEEKKKSKDEDSSSSMSEREGRGESRKSKTTSSKRKGKKRLTIQQNHLIMENMRRGSNLKDVVQQIPGSSVSSIRRQFRKKLKVLNEESENGEIENTIIRIQELIEQVEIVIINRDQSIEADVKIRELKILIPNIENHLHQTKQLILKKYLSLFQQE
ncbi:unnamed protein product (macronuclear) [Paramecium tetraurelia]|uniref:Myb-like domain-containing protein n=1 Tax=Paramecium tetraurelia TaxID=5888 RepID=A0EFD5_PARTE|nr:uncharacterized protein GSPATT00026349001 [Paramecium tetraurelia]CAK94026.1 unnamed protein product [Paramecium tetraurelia]|eukprot:XP_001461399.1 hypothetical protein (macronuclear) [Paramecium tetraurelia strain d4-2]